MSEFLDPKICNEFRKILNQKNIFLYDKEYNKSFSLCCAVIDRLDSCILYLNKHSTPPKTEESFLSFLMFACMVIDAVKTIHKELGIDCKYEKNKAINSTVQLGHFRDIDLKYFSNEQGRFNITDDRFFEYVRALTFAHPFETSRFPEILLNGEKQYSPWVIANTIAAKAIGGTDDCVGLRVYSNKTQEIRDIYIPFSSLLNYLQSKYLLLESATDKIKEIIVLKVKKWRTLTVPNDLPPIDTLQNIIQILKERCEDYLPNEIQVLIDYLEIESTNIENTKNMQEFKNHIISMIPKFCEKINSCEHDSIYKLLEVCFWAARDNIRNKYQYQIEKIYSCSDISWAKVQAKSLYQDFAHKWVLIDIDSMNIREIQFLVTVACYFEYKELQGEEKYDV